VSVLPENDKLAVLCIDAMAIKTVLEYDRKRDIVDGFADDRNVRLSRIATETLVFMVKGLCRKWKQPLCYFLSASAVSGANLRELTLQCIKDLRDIGITVKVVVCDQGATNRALFSLLGITVEHPFIEFDGIKIFLCMILHIC